MVRKLSFFTFYLASEPPYNVSLQWVTYFTQKEIKFRIFRHKQQL